MWQALFALKMSIVQMTANSLSCLMIRRVSTDSSCCFHTQTQMLSRQILRATLACSIVLVALVTHEVMVIDWSITSFVACCRQYIKYSSAPYT
jgi:hypothetical protein